MAEPESIPQDNVIDTEAGNTPEDVQDVGPSVPVEGSGEVAAEADTPHQNGEATAEQPTEISTEVTSATQNAADPSPDAKIHEADGDAHVAKTPATGDVASSKTAAKPHVVGKAAGSVSSVKKVRSARISSRKHPSRTSCLDY